jgi:UDP-glucose 4-epimerase
MDRRELDGQRVLVTGGAGFVGSHLAEALVGHADVRVLDDLSIGRREYVPDGATFVEGDVRDDEALDRHVSRADVVFHQAAIPSVERSVDDPVGCHEVTADATLSLLEAARRNDARVVVASSAAIYGQPEGLPVSESDSTEPASPYGIDKLAVDHYSRRYHDLYGLETVALRYFNVYGPRQTGGSYAGVVKIFRDQALDGRPITVEGDGSQTRDFVHVDDVVRANLLAAETDAVGEAFNVGTGEEVSIRDLAETVRAVADSDSEIVHGEARPGDIDRSVADVTKAKAALGYEPSVDLQDGIGSIVAEATGRAADS